jgi:Lar family restriction alleviation protein
MKELKPCPFCGSEKLDVSDKTTTISWKRKRHVSIYCKYCNSYGPRVLSQEEDYRHAVKESIIKAKELWNRRVIP